MGGGGREGLIQCMCHGTGLYSEMKSLSIYMVKVTKFELPAAYRFSTTEERTVL